MRRSDREVKDFEEIINIIKKCDVCRLAIHDGEYPYILPLNFGMRVLSESITLYFHGAGEGKKYELLRGNDKVGFEMDCSHRLVYDKESGDCGMDYESVIGRGTISFVDGDEKIQALGILMKHYLPDGDSKFNESSVTKTTVMKLSVSELTAKRRMT